MVQNSPTYERRVRRNIVDAAPVLLTVFLLLLLPLAMVSLVFAGVVAASALLILLLGLLGLDRMSVAMMVGAFALAPWDKLSVGFLGISDGLFFLALALALPRLLTTPLPAPGLFAIGAAFFVPTALLASTGSPYDDTFYYCARVIFTLIVLPLMVVWWAPRGKVLIALVIAYVAGTGVSVVWGIPDIGDYRNFGLTQHPNSLGYTAMLSLSLVPFLAAAVTSRWRTWLCVGAVGIAGIGILTSGSRAALVVALVLALLVPAVERSIPFALAIATAGVIAVGTVGRRSPEEGQDALSRLLGAGDVAGSDRQRISGVEKTWETALQHPWLGTGFSFTDFVAHNLFVQVAAAVGFIGLAAFVLLMISMATPILARDNLHSRLAYPVVVFLVAGPVSPNLTDRYIGLLLGLALVGVTQVRQARRTEELTDASTKFLRQVR